MDYNEALQIIKDNHSGKYNIKTSDGRRMQKRLFVCDNYGICEFWRGSHSRGFQLSPSEVEDWASVSKHTTNEFNLVRKFQRYAQKATFDSAFVRKCLGADLLKSCYENGLTTGTRIDGEVISLNAIAKYSPWCAEEFRKALKERRDYRSPRFNFRGYDGSLSIVIVKKDDNYYKKGDVAACFAKEYRGCGNGYYYSLINDENFIGSDID